MLLRAFYDLLRQNLCRALAGRAAPQSGDGNNDDTFPKVYRLANVVQTPHKEVKVEQSVLIGLLETGCLLNLYTTLLVRLHKHLSKGNPIKISRGLHSELSLVSGAAYRSSKHTDHEHLGLFAMVQSIQHQGRRRWHQPLAQPELITIDK